MAVLTSHLLNGVDGSHAGHVGITLEQIDDDGTRRPVLDARTDAGGRLSAEVEVDGAGSYEMVIASGDYFNDFDLPEAGVQFLTEIVIRFRMPDPAGRYHIPVIMAPHNYSCWWGN